MPYRNCPTCGLAVLSAAGHSTRDACPQCGARLDGDPYSRKLSLLTQTAHELRATRGAPSSVRPPAGPARPQRSDVLEGRFAELSRSLATLARRDGAE
jgi:predicted RNA-binding Zn-ribbon protein involved in translation (DUF1610 family)